jgi:hypothetical protein
LENDSVVKNTRLILLEDDSAVKNILLNNLEKFKNTAADTYLKKNIEDKTEENNDSK